MVAPRGSSEADSRELLSSYDVPFAEARVANTAEEAAGHAVDLGFPVVVKVSSDRIAHKSERGLVRVGLRDEESVRRAVEEMAGRLVPGDGDCTWLVSPVVDGRRELLIGLIRDESFGPFVVLGIGGVFAESFDDVALAAARPGSIAVGDLVGSLRNAGLLRAARGEAAVDLDGLGRTLEGLARLAVERPDVHSVDVNPVLVRPDGGLVAVDAMIETVPFVPREVLQRAAVSDEQARALLDPRGILVVGVPNHPGKFGYVTLHNLLANAYPGRLAIVNRSGESVLDVAASTDARDLPAGEFDLAVLCTPAAANEGLLRDVAGRGIKAVFVASAGYRESGPEGAVAEERLAAVARECDVVLIGPNGQGIVSTPASMCAQIVAPFPPTGAISVLSQSGNLVSSFLNYSRASGTGVARAISVGNAASVSPTELLPVLARDPHTRVGLVYLESATSGSALVDAVRSFTRVKPLVVVKGGASEIGARAAASHTGALASPSRVVAAALGDAGASLVEDVEAAFDLAAAFSTLPMPRGDRVAVLTTVGGWGVLTADAIADSGALRLANLSDALLEEIGGLLPGRWSRSNPIDCAGGETRDTVPTLVGILSASDEVDAVIFLGPGIQGNQAAMMRAGRFFPDHGLGRIVDYHERQEDRYATAVVESIAASGKPILVATELAVTEPNNAFVVAARARGLHCFASGPRAVGALAGLRRRARHLEERS